MIATTIATYRRVESPPSESSDPAAAASPSTVTSHVAIRPSAVVAVIVAVPAPAAVTLPLETETTL